MGVVFRSRVDRQFVWLSLALPLALVLALLGTPRPLHPGALLTLGVLIAATLLVSWIFLSTYYDLEHDALVAHAGPFAWRVPLHEIQSVERSRSSRSGPALSLDRLAVTYTGGRVLMISPADLAGFLQLLHRRVPRLAPHAQGPDA